MSLVFVIIGVVGAIALVIGLGWMNYNYCQQNPGGNDFLVHWMGTRMLLKDGISPYSDQTATAIQTFAYGHTALPGEHELRVAYPLYSVLFFIPFALIPDFATARAIWMTLLEISVLLLTFFSLRMVQWKPKLIMLALIFLFSMVWYHAVRTIINGNAVALVALGLLAAFLAIKNDLDEVAGFLLALTTIKPQLVILVIFFILLWAVNRRRWRLISWFLGTMVVLVAVAFLFVPDWIIQNIREILRYPGYNPPGTPGAVFTVWFPAMGNRLGWILSGIMIMLLLVEWFLALRRKIEFPGFLWTVYLTLVASQWIGIQTDPGNFIILFPAIILVFAMWEQRWKRFGTALTVLSLLILTVGIWAIFLSTINFGYQPQQSPVLFFPLPLFLFITLYWTRWWAVRQPRAWFDELYARENFRK
jgi:hypothetical protein